MITARAEGDETPLNMMARERGSSTVLRILLGSQLRRLRENRGITLEAAGHSIRASHSKISRMELGRVSFRARDVADLLTLYGVTEESDREGMLSLVAQANRPGWWHNYDDVLPNWFEAYVGLEEAATRIRSYEVQFIPACSRPRSTPARSSCSATRTGPRRRSSGGSTCGWPGRSCSAGPTRRTCGP